MQAPQRIHASNLLELVADSATGPCQQDDMVLLGAFGIVVPSRPGRQRGVYAHVLAVADGPHPQDLRQLSSSVGTIFSIEARTLQPRQDLRSVAIALVVTMI